MFHKREPLKQRFNELSILVTFIVVNDAHARSYIKLSQAANDSDGQAVCVSDGKPYSFSADTVVCRIFKRGEVV